MNLSLTDGLWNRKEFMEEQETLQAVPRWELKMNAQETLTVYGCFITELRRLVSLEDPALDSISGVVDLMRQLRPAAVEASESLK